MHWLMTLLGRIVEDLSQRSPSKALLVEAHEPGEPDDRLAIWQHPGAAVLHCPRQVWVHVDYRNYRRAYLRAFPAVDLTSLVLDHVMNRRVARLKDFAYLRIISISREQIRYRITSQMLYPLEPTLQREREEGTVPRQTGLSLLNERSFSIITLAIAGSLFGKGDVTNDAD